MKLLFDQNLSHRLVGQLSTEFPGSAHVRDAGLAASPDLTVWTHAAAGGFMLVSKDTDFQQRALLYGHPPKVIWVRLGNCSTEVVGGAAPVPDGGYFGVRGRPRGSFSGLVMSLFYFPFRQLPAQLSYLSRPLQPADISDIRDFSLESDFAGRANSTYFSAYEVSLDAVTNCVIRTTTGGCDMWKKRVLSAVVLLVLVCMAGCKHRRGCSSCSSAAPSNYCPDR